MPYYTKLGLLPQKRHVQFRRPDGCLYSEEVFGTEGFVGPTTTMYHIHPPTQVYGWKPLYSTKVEYVETDIMRMRHVKSAPLPPKGDFITGRVVLFGNSDCEMAVCNPAEQLSYHYKNGQGDECIFIHFGSGVCHTMLGTLKFGPRDYLVIPKGVIYTIVWNKRQDTVKFAADGTASDAGPSLQECPFGKYLLIETTNGSHIGPPPRYVSKMHGQYLEHSPMCERDLRLPEQPMTWDQKGNFEVRIKARDLIHSYTYHYHPLDIVGWDGCYYPFIFNADDFSPITGKVHLPPPIHQTFEAHNFVICTFAPRVLDYHPQAIKVPYNHSNLDSDEVLYYVEGNYKARKGIEVGSLTLHPQGIPHGPHPGTVEATLEATYTNELAVMCDTFKPLFPTKAALQLDDVNYPKSWEGEHFPGLSAHKIDLGHMSYPPASAAAFPRELKPVDVIKAEVSQTVMPAPRSSASAASTTETKTTSANVWAP
ncbi:MAG: homogentisate 1,2-dioxygenase [Phycisphaerales bacterium]|jgi:homogentisate 1,2-dioxygenase|nr:homogentisate 1,2-dioxygenase [Phycisphaerales bacterium]